MGGTRGQSQSGCSPHPAQPRAAVCPSALPQNSLITSKQSAFWLGLAHALLCTPRGCCPACGGIMGFFGNPEDLCHPRPATVSTTALQSCWPFSVPGVCCLFPRTLLVPVLSPAPFSHPSRLSPKLSPLVTCSLLLKARAMPLL